MWHMATTKRYCVIIAIVKDESSLECHPKRRCDSIFERVSFFFFFPRWVYFFFLLHFATQSGSSIFKGCETKEKDTQQGEQSRVKGLRTKTDVWAYFLCSPLVCFRTVQSVTYHSWAPWKTWTDHGTIGPVSFSCCLLKKREREREERKERLVGCAVIC